MEGGVVVSSTNDEAIAAALAMLGVSIIPVYSQYVLFEIVGMKGWYAFLMFIPFVGALIVAILSYIAYYKLAICFGKESGFGIGMIFLPFVFGLILAFSDATYTKPATTN